MSTTPEGSFDVVYYTGPAPSSWHTLATLALVFDRVHFPGVYMGTEGLDGGETVREFERIRAAFPGKMEMDNVHLLNLMLLAIHRKYIDDVCVFPGAFGTCGTLEPGAERLMMALEEQYFGPPPPNFHPSPSSGFAKGLPGTATTGINAPSWLCYPANAFLYSAQRGLPYVNDDPTMPVLAPPGPSAKNNAKLLSAIVAMECVRLTLPALKPLRPPEIQELRERTRDHVQPFRRAMLKLTKEVNAQITSESTMDDIVGAARFIFTTEVEPQLEELRKLLGDSGRHWTERLVDLSRPATVLLAGASTLPELIAKVLTGLLPMLASEAAAERKKQAAKKSGLYFLLKLENR